MKLTLRVENPRITTLEAFRVQLTLLNDGGTAVTIPGPFDLTHALTLEARRADGTPVVVMNGLTRQALTSRGRIDTTPLLETLDAGAEWRWSLDLARYHQPLPVGAAGLEALYHHEESGTAARSGPVPVEVIPARLTDLALLEDAPVLDGLTLLLRGASPDGDITLLRQHDAARPLAAWYSAAIEGGTAGCRLDPPLAWDGPVAPFLAAARYRTNDSFDPTFVKWVISTDGREVRAHCVELGRPDPTAGTAAVPEGLTLLNSASYDEENRLLLAFRRADGAVEVHEMGAGRLEKLFELPLPRTTLPPLLRWDCDHLHVVSAERGALYGRLTHDGAVEQRMQAAVSDLPAVHLDVDPFRRLVRLLSYDPAAGERRKPAVELTVIGPEPESVARVRYDDPLPGASLTEMDFDVDAAGGFHLLLATDAGALHYLAPGGASHLVAEGEARWRPRVRAARGVLLGWFAEATGHRFRPFREGRPVPVAGEPGDAP